MISTPIETTASNDYHFVTRWRFEATREEIYEILGDPPGLPRWWSEVYLKVEEVQPGDEDGLGRVIALHTKGWLPYTLKWQFRVTHAARPSGFSLVATGDFVGTGEWTFIQDGDEVEVVYDWRIRAEKPFIRRLSWLLKPVFSANHHWAMNKGEAALRRELVRIREMKRHADSIFVGR
ncbi:MAG: SRPBCC family protein [Armatimonadetes bacterium]|nr:SRPBCC family protein [Armatimonadota bacterium]